MSETQLVELVNVSWTAEAVGHHLPPPGRGLTPQRSVVLDFFQNIATGTPNSFDPVCVQSKAIDLVLSA